MHFMKTGNTENSTALRNRRKFFMQYGFDIIEYVSLAASGKTEEEIMSTLGVLPCQLEHYYKSKRKRYKY
ncbi:MAG: hypothetical protein GX318_00345 [Clostridia bacterium]|nr:hypothetical protein [Clostridia bacterium]